MDSNFKIYEDSKIAFMQLQTLLVYSYLLDLGYKNNLLLRRIYGLLDLLKNKMYMGIGIVSKTDRYWHVLERYYVAIDQFTYLYLMLKYGEHEDEEAPII